MKIGDRVRVICTENKGHYYKGRLSIGDVATITEVGQGSGPRGPLSFRLNNESGVEDWLYLTWLEPLELSTTTYRLVPVEDIEDLEKARLELHRAMEALNIHTALYSHITEPMRAITHRKYEEVEK